MKKGLVILVVLAFAAPLYADVTFGPAVDNQDGTCSIPWSSDDLPIVAMGLDVDVTGDDDIGDLAYGSFFDIFMDQAYDEEAGDGYTYGEDKGNGPVARQDQPGQLALPQTNFCISMGGLGGASEPLDDPCMAGTIVLTADPCNSSGTLSENALRGGVIDENGAQVTTNLPIPFGITTFVPPTDCMAAMDVDTNFPAVYAMFLKAEAYFGVGNVDCWCDEYNCQGDANGGFAGVDTDGKRKWVTLPDLTVLSAGWGKKESVMPGGSPLPICADSDRSFAGVDTNGKRKWVTLPDLTILSASWGKKESVMPTGPHQVPCHGYE